MRVLMNPCFLLVAAWLDDPLNRVLTVADAEYPQFLLNTADPPLLLYVKGRLDLLNATSLAVVGSRNASAQGLRNAEAFANSVSDAGLCVVSGMAHGYRRGRASRRSAGGGFQRCRGRYRSGQGLSRRQPRVGASPGAGRNHHFRIFAWARHRLPQIFRAATASSAA